MSKYLQKKCITQKLWNKLLQCSIACLKDISIGLKFKFRKVSYFVPIWPPKFKMSVLVQNILNIEITQRQHYICNSSFEKVIYKDRNTVYQ